MCSDSCDLNVCCEFVRVSTLKIAYFGLNMSIGKFCGPDYRGNQFEPKTPTNENVLFG